MGMAMKQDLFSDSILQYLVEEEPYAGNDGEPTKLPPMGDLAKRLGVSRGKLREDLITAQAYGIVEMRPGDGTYLCPFDFYAAITPPLQYSLACDKRNFDHLYKLRAHLEVGFWDEATAVLDADDHERMNRLLRRAERKLAGTPVEIPNPEHRELHLLIYNKLNNPFVFGLLKAYWDAYEAIGLHRYHDMGYYERMWRSHRQMVDAIFAGEIQRGKEVLIGHFAILEDRLQHDSARQDQDSIT
jgi:DNA-binding FadR family transcriptional regulator